MATLLLLRRRYKHYLRRERVFRDRTNVLESLDDVDLIERYRFPRHVIVDIINSVDPIVGRSTIRTNAVPTYTQVLVTLRYLGKGDFYSEVGDLHGISRASVSRIIHEVCVAINSTLENITFPNDADTLRSLKADFFKIAHFPNCVGAIDGTLIPIKGMSGLAEPAFICRKNFCALNIQAVADPNMRFLHINTCFPGASHDAYVLRSSGVPAIMETLPEGGWLLGDSGYPLKEWLLIPFLTPSNPQEEKYNEALSKTRIVVERAFGVLKSRFRCLHSSGGGLRFSPQRCSKVIETCFRLHNTAIIAKIPLRQQGPVQNINRNDVVIANVQGTAQQLRIRVAGLL